MKDVVPYGISQKAMDDILKFAVDNDIKKLILFGSRAKGTYTPKSDIDLAASGGDVMNFYYDVEEKARTLLMFDVVDMDKSISDKLKKEIERDGIVIYGEVQ